jgi:aminoglycoside/choline kinase family phosphotransferase
MLMDAPPEKEDCVPFVTIDEFFDANGVRVPHIVAKDLDQGFLLLEDFGDVLLSTLLTDETVDSHYAQSFAQLIQLQSIDGVNHFPEYSYEKLLSEMALLTDWLLPSLKIEPTADESALIKRTFAILANAALAQPQVIVHRDFHSRNLMVLAEEKEQGVITCGCAKAALAKMAKVRLINALSSAVGSIFKDGSSQSVSSAISDSSFS